MERRVQILLVEDNPADADLTIAALRDAIVLTSVHILHDGESAIAFLKREGEHASAPRPDIILLDMNLPRIDGHGVLEVLKSDPDLRQIPVIVVSNSERESDVARAYDSQIAAYVVKPIQLDEYFNVIRSIKELWFHRVALPPKREAAGAKSGR